MKIKYGLFGWDDRDDFFQVSNLTVGGSKEVAKTLHLKSYQIVPMNGSDYPNARFICYLRNDETGKYDSVGHKDEWLPSTYHFSGFTPHRK